MNRGPLVEVLHAVDFELLALALANVLAVEVEHFDWLQFDKKVIFNEIELFHCHAK